MTRIPELSSEKMSVVKLRDKMIGKLINAYKNWHSRKYLNTKEYNAISELLPSNGDYVFVSKDIKMKNLFPTSTFPTIYVHWEDCEYPNKWFLLPHGGKKTEHHQTIRKWLAEQKEPVSYETIY